mmetsp:Transcript_80126/g.180772  ORF Transcript_80126/g.180772 Transcript_80126/m.180772 type:complete len:219 (+) Transcript_80126:849-1505(+)
MLVDVVRKVCLRVMQRGKAHVPSVLLAAKGLPPVLRTGPLRARAPAETRHEDQVLRTSLADGADSCLRPLPPELGHLSAFVHGVGVEVPLLASFVAVVRLAVETEDDLVVASPLLRHQRPQLGKVGRHGIRTVVHEAALAVVWNDDDTVVQVSGDVVDHLLEPVDGIQLLRAKPGLQALPHDGQPETVGTHAVEELELIEAWALELSVAAAVCVQAEA